MYDSIKCFLIMFLIFFAFQLETHAKTIEVEGEEHSTSNLLEQIDVNELEGYWSEIQNDYRHYLPDIDKITVKDLITNGQQLSLFDWIQSFIGMVGHELILNGKLLGQLIVIAIISALIKNIQSSFQSESVTVVANFVLMILLTTLALQSFTVISQLITTTISQMHSFIIALLPLLLGLMASLGGVISSAFFHPIIISFLYLIVGLTDKVFVNFIFLSLILHLVSHMNKTFQLTKLGDLLRQFSMALMFICLTIFLTVLSTKGAVTAIQDGLTVKTAKFVTSNFVPVVGRMFSEASDTIFATTQVLKNGLGLFGLIFLFLIVGFPIIKVAVVGSLYRLAAAILQPIGDEQVVKSITVISDHIFYLLAILLVVSFMFLMTIVILLVASNLTLMIR
ncbi:stage III sporulation protein AE [Amphibacillus sp. MSJ-3]|uniref:stage III sporulation protein AE n=1 Tax=Amphibacillus sp. MSJ-3 TaxID=2841505 RepID=UPI001C0E9158|nr:stage III sporulation protein AE [Amphibacillus sp. MSJ-3]MBU5594796.1 stage III sporulation protein AE [Amphibacillus sp. MSJ-3]